MTTYNHSCPCCILLSLSWEEQTPSLEQNVGIEYKVGMPAFLVIGYAVLIASIAEHVAGF